MMKIKNNIYHVIFFDLSFVAISLFLLALGFFLGFDEPSRKEIAIYVGINGLVVFLGAIVCVGYVMFCKTHYEFTNDSIKIVTKGVIAKEIRYAQIRFYEYCGFYELFLGDPSGGRLVIFYNENGIEQRIEISCLKRIIKKVDYFKNV